MRADGPAVGPGFAGGAPGGAEHRHRWPPARGTQGSAGPRPSSAVGAGRVPPAPCSDAALRELRRSRVRGGARACDGAAVPVLRRVGGRAPPSLPPKVFWCFLCKKAGSVGAYPAPWEVLVESFVPKLPLSDATCSSRACGTVNSVPAARGFALSIRVSAAAGSPGHLDCGVFCEVAFGALAVTGAALLIALWYGCVGNLRCAADRAAVKTE